MMMKSSIFDLLNTHN